MVNQVRDKPLLEEMRDLLRRLGYAYGTEKTYCDWAARFIRFHHLQSRDALLVDAEVLVERFLTFLAVEKCCACYAKSGVKCIGFFVF